MKNELINVTDDELILLGEGELSVEARDDLFRRLDEHPQQWRACATTVLEAKAVADSLHQLRDELSANACSETNSGLGVQLASLSQVSTAQIDTRQVRRLGHGFTAASVLLALTAGLLLGYQANSQMAKRNGEPSTRMASSEVLANEHEANIKQASVQSILRRLNVGDERLLAIVRVEHNGVASFVPVVESPRMEEQFRRHPLSPIPSQGIRSANRAGWNITQQRQLLAIENPGEEVELLLVGLWNLKPVGQNVL